MKASLFTAGQYLKAADLGGRAVQARINNVTAEDFDEGQKLCLHFDGKEQGMVLNKTNTGIILAAYGDETDGWAGKIVEIYPDKVPFGGKLVDALRVRIPVAPAAPLETVPAAAPAADPAQPATTEAAPFNDDIPW